MAKITVAANPTFLCPVDIHVAGAGSVPVKFEFKHRTADEMTAWSESMTGRVASLEVVLECVVGWDSKEDFDRPFSKESLGEFLQAYPSAGNRIVSTYMLEMAGARLGN